MNQDQLRYFISVADEGSFTKAEASNYVSKQAIIKQINALENEVGFKLFDRKHTGLSLTDAGRSFYADCKDILLRQEAAVNKAKRLVSVNNSITIGQTEYNTLLVDVTKQFQILHPSIAIDFVIHGNHSNRYRVEHNIVDIGEVAGQFKTQIRKDCAYERIVDLPYMFVMDPQHPLARKSALTIKDIKKYPIIVFRNSTNLNLIKKIQAMDLSLHFVTNADLQLKVVYKLLGTQSLLLTANHFIYSVQEVKRIPLSPELTQEYGVIYKKEKKELLLPYIQLAKEMYEKKRPR